MTEPATPAPLSGADLRAACEAFARKRGWRQLDPRWPGEDRWQNFTYHRADEWCELSEAIRIEWARDGIGGAT